MTSPTLPTQGRPLARKRLSNGFLDARGNVAIEFLIAIPILTFFVLLVLQFVFFLHIKVVVDYSAFAAARSAAVWIPASTGPRAGVPLDTPLTGSGQSDGAIRIHHAAALACVPVSLPSTNSAEGYTTRFAFKRTWLRGSPQLDEIKRHVNGLVYAKEATRVTLKVLRSSPRSGPVRRYVLAEVQFIAPLVVPFAGPMLGNSMPPSGLPLSYPFWQYLRIPGRLPTYGFYTMRSRYVLPIEDEVRL